MSAGLLGAFGPLGSRDMLKEIIKEIIREEPELILEVLGGAFQEITEQIEHAQNVASGDRVRISDIEILLGIDEDLKDPDSPYYQEKNERQEELKKISCLGQQNQTNINKNPDEKLYNELKHRGFMKTNDVLKFMGLNHYQQARRIMDKLASEYEEVYLDKNENGKGYRMCIIL